MTRETMKRRKETAGVIRKIDAHDMATKKALRDSFEATGA